MIVVSAAIDMSRPQMLAILDGLRGSVRDAIRGDKMVFLINLLVAVYCTKLIEYGLSAVRVSTPSQSALQDEPITSVLYNIYA